MMSHRFVRFAMVGGAGFVVDAATYAIGIYVLALPIELARVIAFALAASTTWFGNRCWTFGVVDQSVSRQWSKSFISALVSSLPNLGVFKLTLFFLGKDDWALWIALVTGVLAGMFFNYVLSSRWVFVPATAPLKDSSKAN